MRHRAKEQQHAPRSCRPRQRATVPAQRTRGRVQDRSKWELSNGSSYIPDHKSLREVLLSVEASLANPAPQTLKVNGHTQLDGETEINTDDPILIKTTKPIAGSTFPLRIEGDTLISGNTVHAEACAGVLKLESQGTESKTLHLRATSSNHTDAIFAEGKMTVSGDVL